MKRKLCFILFIGSVLFFSCKKSHAPVPQIAIGQNYGGGVVFYVDSVGQHGLIVAINDQSTSTQWLNGSYIVTGAISDINGFTNTSLIINTQGNTGSYAAKICKDYRGGGFSDWFLPSIDQLTLLFDQKYAIGLNLATGGNWGNGNYWSSTETTNINAKFENLYDGTQWEDSKNLTLFVRAIRSF